ncbi:hypothetical protein H7J07_01105 [Mycobacterium koreense]|nr:hypothetical protein [Mycolicibacillus koreensis]MCV7246857.1 hypothetical protein [Mycolicibacillus koreensis]
MPRPVMSSRRTRVAVAVSIVAGAVAATTSMVGCSRSVGGAAHLGADARAPLEPLLLAPERFPAPYDARVLSAAEDVDRSLWRIDGAGPDAVVTPPSCAPPRAARPPHNAVATVGTDPGTGATLTVAITRTASALEQRRAQLAACPTITVEVGGLRTEVRPEILAAPPVDADASYAVRQTELVDGARARSLLTLVAQVEDIRVTASWSGPDTAGPDAEAPDAVGPDAEALDEVFLDAVLHARRHR